MEDGQGPNGAEGKSNTGPAGEGHKAEAGMSPAAQPAAETGPPSTETDSPTEEFLAILPEGTELPNGFAAEAKKRGLDPSGSHPLYPYPTRVVGAGAPFDPASLSLDWRLSAPRDSDAYKEAAKNPKDSLDANDRKSLKIMIDMGLPPTTD